MYSTRSSARRVTMDDPPLEGSYHRDGDEVYDASPINMGYSRGKRRGPSILHDIKEPPRSIRLRRTSSVRTKNSSYTEAESDDESYYLDQVTKTSDKRQPSGRSSFSSVNSKVEQMHVKESKTAHIDNDSRMTRSSRSRTPTSFDISSQKRTRRDNSDAATTPAEKRRRGSEVVQKMKTRGSQEEDDGGAEVEEEDVDVEEEEEEEDEDEDEEEEESTRKYSLRDRESSKRETMNISVLGGDGGGYARSAGQGATRSLRSGEHNVAQQPRMYLGGKIPNFAHARYRRSNNRANKHSDHHRQKSHGEGTRRHFDSSSDSSSDDAKSSVRDRIGNSKYSHEHGGNDDVQFNRYENERLQAERDSVQPLNMESLGGFMSTGGGDMNSSMGGSLRDKASQKDMLRADAAPVAVDPRLGFQSIGGLEKHVQALKEMVVLPLLYPDVFQRFDTQPPRGVLFVGPPGTGKTLTARALANSVTMSAAEGGRKVSFFMRKGADCLSKWVGEGERQLRLLFEQAKRYQPSIIFFDEIDGLAPVRSVKQDQIHASIVSTLLALMDGLDSRGQVVVIGATNRPDAIDPALRRPGRFDRELFFPLPDAKARAAIIEINTGSWQPSPSSKLKEWLVKSTAGYCGADLKALCAEAALVALRRAYPEVYESTTRLELDPKKLILGKGDFAAALNKVIPASRRGVAGTPARALSNILTPLLREPLAILMKTIRNIITFDDNHERNNEVVGSSLSVPSSSSFSSSSSSLSEDNGSDYRSLRIQEERLALDNVSPDSEAWIAALTDMQETSFLRTFLGNGLYIATEDETDCMTLQENNSTLWDSASVTSHPRMMVVGGSGMNQNDLVAAAIQLLEGLPCFAVDHPSLLADLNAHSPEQALVNRVQEACRTSPSVIYLPNVTSWWAAAPDGMKSALITLLEAIPSSLPVLWLTTLTLNKNEMNLLDQTGCISIEDDTLASLVRSLSGSKKLQNESKKLRITEENCNILFLKQSNIIARKEIFHDYFHSLLLLPSRLYAARKQVITAKMKIQKSVKKIEIMDLGSEFQQTHQSLQGSDRSLRSGPNKEEMNYKDEKQLINNHQIRKSQILQSLPMTEDSDKQCVRELRNFLRATLGELHKEKKCLVFWRPVDPESVPDYYDVVLSPMDLETMRMKVDAFEYPTLSHFLRDLEQIVFNAKEYNPLTIKDVRGRSIVHAAHSMGDIVESHAYNFKKEVGYDLFKQCEEIAERLRISRPVPPQNGDQMTELTAKYYSEILQIHERVKEEEGEEHPTFIKLSGLKLERQEREQREEREERQEREEREEREKALKETNETTNQLLRSDTYLKTLGQEKMDRQKEVEKDEGRDRIRKMVIEREVDKEAKICRGKIRDGVGSKMEGRDEEQREHRAVLTDASDDSQLDDTAQDPPKSDRIICPSDDYADSRNSAVVINPERKEIEEVEEKKRKEREEISIKEEILQTDIDSLPVMLSLLQAITAVNKIEKDKVFDIYEESFVQNTENCSNSEIVDISTGLYRISRAFQYHNNWDTFLLDLKNYSLKKGIYVEF